MMEQVHHIVIMTNKEDKKYPIGIAFANEQDEIISFVPMDLVTADKFGQSFFNHFNEMLIHVRGDT